MLNSFVLCCNFCACKGACAVVVRFPRGGGGGSLATVPKGVVGDRFPGGEEGRGGGYQPCGVTSHVGASKPTALVSAQHRDEALRRVRVLAQKRGEECKMPGNADCGYHLVI